MSALACLHCGAETTNGLALCERHLRQLEEIPADLAAWFADVDRLPPGSRLVVHRTPESQAPSSAEDSDRIGTALAQAENAVGTWCRVLAEERDLAPPALEVRELADSIRRAAGWLGSHATTIATCEWAAECLRDLRRSALVLRRVLDNADTGRFIGICGHRLPGRPDGPDGEPVVCTRGLYAVEGERWKTCPECGLAHDVERRREQLRREIADRLAPLRVVARAAVALTPEEPSVERATRRIEQWVRRGRLRDCGLRHYDDGSGPDPVARRHYRIGDVLALMERDTRVWTHRRELVLSSVVVPALPDPSRKQVEGSM